MSVDVDIPQPFNATLGLSGAVDLDLDDIHVSVDRLPTVNLNTDNQVNLTSSSAVNADIDADVDLKSTSKVDLDSDSKVELESDSKFQLDSDSKVDLGLDNIRIRELPEIKFEFGLRPMRIHFPLNFKWRLSILGCEVFNFETCGESMVVAENLKKHKSEHCE